MSTGKQAAILTFGCQMNVHDSELIAGLLTERGFTVHDDTARADIILINTCSVRDNAEQRVLARFRELAALKRKKPHLKLGICGCMARRYGRDILAENPHIDFVIGPGQYRLLPDLLEDRDHAVAVADNEETYAGIDTPPASDLSGWIAIMRGCNNFCTYCIVPHVRGRERSLPADEIIRQLKRMPASVKEVTLLGQNVNSYRDGGTGFAQLLRRVGTAAGDRRIRFTTSHPKDLSDDTIAAIAETPAVCEHIHLALQSGSDRVLKAMNRRYTAGGFRRRIAAVRAAMPHAAVTTDLIVGFPGETDADFRQTLALVEELEFDTAFMFRYSPRPGTAAAEMEDTVSDAEKGARLEELIALQLAITDRVSRRAVGRTEEVLVEGPSKKDPAQWTGRSRTNKYVILESDRFTRGQFVQARITRAAHLTLFGTAPDS